MKKLQFLLCILFVFSSGAICQQAHYEVKGKINEKENGKYIMLFKFKSDSISSVDTTTVKNGTFHFQGDEVLNDLAMITIGNYPDVVRIVELALERGIINVNMDSLSITGTPLNALYKNYLYKYKQYGIKLDSLYKKDKKQAMVKGSELNKLYRETCNYQKDFIKGNLTNPVGLRIFYDAMRNIYVDDFNEILTVLPKQYRSEPQMIDEINDRKISQEKNDKRLSLVGTKYHDFDLITPKNEKRKLSDYVSKTKYVFLDFWSSWCSPCIADIPYLKKVYEKYKSKGLEIISVSLDTSIDSWKKTLQRVDAPWVHLSDLQGIPSELTKAYGVYGIPQAFLIDQNGTIIELDLRGESLGVVLERLLKE